MKRRPIKTGCLFLQQNPKKWQKKARKKESFDISFSAGQVMKKIGLNNLERNITIEG